MKYIHDVRHIENEDSKKFENELKLTVTLFQSKGCTVDVQYNVLPSGKYTALVISYGGLGDSL